MFPLPIVPLLAVESSGSPPHSPTSSMSASPGTSPDDMVLSLDIPTRPAHLGHRRTTSSGDLGRRNAVRRSMHTSSRKSSAASLASQPIPIPIPNPDAEPERHARFEAVPPAYTRGRSTSISSSASVSPTSPEGQAFRARWRKRSLRRSRPPPDRQLTFLNELSGDELDGPATAAADTEFDLEDPEEAQREEMFARAAELLRLRVAASAEAHRMERIEMRRSAVGSFHAY